VKRIIQTQIPNLNEYEDISDYVLKGAGQSESDIEDAVNNRTVSLPSSGTGLPRLAKKKLKKLQYV